MVTFCFQDIWRRTVWTGDWRWVYPNGEGLHNLHATDLRRRGVHAQQKCHPSRHEGQFVVHIRCTLRLWGGRVDSWMRPRSDCPRRWSFFRKVYFISEFCFLSVVFVACSSLILAPGTAFAQQHSMKNFLNYTVAQSMSDSIRTLLSVWPLMIHCLLFSGEISSPSVFFSFL